MKFGTFITSLKPETITRNVRKGRRGRDSSRRGLASI